MDFSAPSDIVQLGIEAAKELLGDDAQVRLTVEVGAYFTDDPVYQFFYRIRKGKVYDYPPGLLRIRLIQRLTDKLAERGDTRFPLIQLLELTDRVPEPDA